MKVRSELLKMQRMSADAAQRYAIGKEVDGLNDAIKSSLKNTTLLDNWTEANRLWSKGHALREVADAIRDSTKGTPQAEQLPGIAPIPAKLEATSLVRRLNTLAEDGVLKRAFTPEEVRNLRQSADILDRIQRTHVGTGEGGGAAPRRGLIHILTGSKARLAGAGVGAGVGAVVGGLRGAELGAGVGAGLVYLTQSITEPMLAKAMTRVEGAKSLKAIEAAKTPAQLQTAMKTLATVAAGSAAQQPKTLKELQAIAAAKRPAGYDVSTGTSASQ
jgi:hypothetical protein